MSLRINHNMSALNTLRSVVQNTNAQAKTMEKLSSGLKINYGTKTNIFKKNRVYMATIDTSIGINAPVDRVWDIISDLDNEPKFWKGTKETRIISRDGNVVTREITIAFRDSKCMQKITIQPKEKIYAEFTKGIIKGSKTLTLKTKDDGSLLEANWDVKMSGLAGMFTGIIKKHIRSGTEQALESIKQKVENS